VNERKMGRKMENSNKVKNLQLGRIRPLILGILILILGLWMDRWWWRLGALIIVVVAVEGYYRYRSLD
jgi:predicted RND superfamily exporter protein